MKKALALVVLIISNTMAFAQGTVSLQNQTGQVRQWTSETDPTLINVPKGGGYVQLIAAPRGTALPHPLISGGTGDIDFASLSAFLAANPGWAAAVNDDGAVPGLIGLAAGIFNDGVYTIQNIAPGADADYFLLGWTGGFASLDAALVAGWGMAGCGESAIATTATGDPLATPPGAPVSLRSTFGGMALLPFSFNPIPPAPYFNYTINNNLVTILGWDGPVPCGAMTIPSTILGLPVTSIGPGAFSGYPALTSLTIPASVTNIGDSAFSRCTNLSAITVDALNPAYSSSDGVLLNKSQITLIQCPGGKVGSYTIPNSVTTVWLGAFDECNKLTNLVIPSSVTYIWSDAFSGCSRLAAFTVDTNNPSFSSLDGVLFNKRQTTLNHCPMGKVGSYTIPNSVTSIGDGAFEDCTSLTDITIPNSVTSIGDLDFFGCSSLISVTIPNSVTTIGNEAFDGCTSLTDVTIPSSVTSIGDYAFSGCAKLAAFTVDTNNPSFSSLDGVLFNKRQTTLIQCPRVKAGRYSIPNSVTSIAYFAFAGCGSLTSVTIPDSVTTIGLEAFSDCTSLASVMIGKSVTNIESYAFYDCNNLTSVTISSGVTTIGYSEFYGCSNLTSITIPSSVTNIGYDAFYYCTSLTSVYFRGNAPYADSDVFNYGNSKATVYYLPGTTGWGPFFWGSPTAPGSPPVLLIQPTSQTAEVGSGVRFRIGAIGYPSLAYQWSFNTNVVTAAATNAGLVLTNVQYLQSGTYSVVLTNIFGSATSAPAILSVIPPVERRVVPALALLGQLGSLLHLDDADALGPSPSWVTFDNVTLTNSSQWYFDVSMPLPPQRFYRVWQTGGLSVLPSPDLKMVPAITMTGPVGSSVRMDYINQFGPTGAWLALGTVTLANTSQLYFDVSAPGQPPRLYRLVQVP